MKDQVLSIKQMQHLKELGIDASKAKLYWAKQVNSAKCNDSIDGKPFISLCKSQMTYGFVRFEVTPTFTLQDMIELMPNNVKCEGKSYYLSIDKKFIGYIDDMDVEDCVLESDGNILENAYNVLVWLAENKYINKDEK